MIILNKLTEEQLAVIKAHQNKAWTTYQNNAARYNGATDKQIQDQNRRLNAAHKGQAAFFQQFNQVKR